MKDRLKAVIPAIDVLSKKLYPLSEKASFTSQPRSFDTGSSPSKLGEVTKAPGFAAGQAIYRMGKVIHVTGLSRSSIYRLEALGLFPGRVKLSASASGWRSQEVDAWIANRPLATVAKETK